ncbi:MAG TPA: acyl-CoA dehydrogenase family protein [Roseiarcus sp.]|jgi:hypothetical protein
MNTNASAPIAVSNEIPSFDLSPNAHRIASDEEALAVASQLAAEFALEAAQRDRERRLPAKELDRFSGSGLWGITVPKAYGGAGVSFATLAEVIAIISAADPNLGQLPQNHLAALDAIRVTASEEQKRLWFRRVLQGYRLGNAFSEAKSKHVGAFETTLRREGDSFVVNGEKFYATDAKAKAKYEDYKQYISFDGALALGSGWMGIDFGRYKPDEPLRHIETNAVQSSVEAFSSADPNKVWTIRELAEWIGIGGLGPLFVGGPETTADLIEEWVEETDVDGFNLAYAVTHETFNDITEHLVPELQKRGRYKRDYAPGTLREKLFGAGPRLPQTQPGARFRDLASAGSALHAAE